MNKPLPIRTNDRVYLDDGRYAWTVLDIHQGKAILRSVTAYPTVLMRDVPVSRLTHTRDLT